MTNNSIIVSRFENFLEIMSTNEETPLYIYTINGVKSMAAIISISDITDIVYNLTPDNYIISIMTKYGAIHSIKIDMKSGAYASYIYDKIRAAITHPNQEQKQE